MSILPQTNANEREGLLQRRREAELERQKRIFDPKLRTMGVDKAALDAQVAEKKRLKELEKQRESQHDDQANMMDQIAVYLQSETEKMRAQEAVNVEKYRQTFQKRELRREWDLYDPHGLQKELPVRIGEGDPRCGPSSGQMFAGEDLAVSERRKAQYEQQRKWAQQQVDERDARRLAELEREREIEEREEDMRARGQQVDDAMRARRAEVIAATATFNKSLAAAKARQMANDRERETMRNLQEIVQTIESPLMAENSATHDAASRKGMTADQKAAIKAQQEQQIAEAAAARRAEAERLAREAAEESNIHAMAARIDRQRQQDAQRKRQEILAEQMRQSEEAKARRKHENDLYRGVVSNEFLDCFNKSSR